MLFLLHKSRLIIKNNFSIAYNLDCTSPFLVHFHTDAAVDGAIASAIVLNNRGK